MKEKPTLNDLKLVINKWGGKNIPTVYLEGESWYEVLQILANKVHESLKWIDDYFYTDLNSIVEQELNELLDDGTIQDIINEAIEQNINLRHQREPNTQNINNVFTNMKIFSTTKIHGYSSDTNLGHPITSPVAYYVCTITRMGENYGQAIFTTSVRSYVGSWNGTSFNWNKVLKDSTLTELLERKADKSELDTTNDRISNLIINSGDANAEVLDAHVSIVKNKTFNTIGERLNELEDDNSQLSSFILEDQTSQDEKIKNIEDGLRFEIKNIVDNGSFLSLSSWGKTGSSGGVDQAGLSLDSNTTLVGNRSALIDSVEGNPRFYQTKHLTAGHKYYVRASAYIHASAGNDNTVARAQLIDRFDFNPAILNKWQTVSGVVEASRTGNSDLWVGVPAQDRATCKVNYDGVMVIDLTSVFGKVNEPDVSLLDTIVDNEYNGFIDDEAIILEYQQYVGYVEGRFTKLFEKTKESQTPRNVGYIRNPELAEYTGQSLITFSYDDGRKNNLYRAIPLHEKHGIPATFNINTHDFDRFDYMTQSEVRECFERDIEIAPHGHSHSNLITLEDEQVHFELSESKRILEDIIGTTVETMAIPFSDYDNRVREIAKEYYKGVRGWGKEINNKNTMDRYHIQSRIAVTRNSTFESLKAVIDEAVFNGGWTVIMMHGVVNKDSDRTGMYETSQGILDKVLEYINSFDRNVLLPVNTKDGLRFILGDNY